VLKVEESPLKRSTIAHVMLIGKKAGMDVGRSQK
jgi:hypothetical protein